MLSRGGSRSTSINGLIGKWTKNPVGHSSSWTENARFAQVSQLKTHLAIFGESATTVSNTVVHRKQKGGCVTDLAEKSAIR